MTERTKRANEANVLIVAKDRILNSHGIAAGFISHLLILMFQSSAYCPRPDPRNLV